MLRQLRKLLRKNRRKLYSRGIIVESRQRIKQLFGLVMLIILAHSAAMMIFEDMSFGDALWLSLTTINTTGYGDVSSSTLIGRSFTVILMYFLGITLMAQLATEYIEYRFEKKERKAKGLWDWKDMKDHIVIINTPKYAPQLYLERLVKQLRQTPKFSNHPICIITEEFADGLPLSLLDSNVVHVHGDGRSRDALTRADVMDAEYITLVAPDTGSINSDSITLDILFHLSQLEVKATLITEVVDDSNRSRFLQLGSNAVIRPIRAYPELIVRAMEAPGSEKFMENLFGHEGDSALRFDCEFSVEKWSLLACHLINLGLGTPVGFVKPNGDVCTNPAPLKSAAGIAIILLVHQDHVPSQKVVENAIKSISQGALNE
ncbi:ion channel [Aliikangiella sp. IMCC44653]